MAADTEANWALDADYIQACNCDYGCPCEFSAPPTQGFCDGIGAWRIHQGHYHEVSLHDLCFAFAVHWPKAIHEGNGTLCLFFDERANLQQRDALLEIASGKAGGLPFEILITTISKVLEPRYAPFQFHFNGRNSSVRIGDFLAASTAPIKNPVTDWREGGWGAFLMGLRHGSYCLGCCWLLMALLFVAGVMNLLWVAALTILVLLEKAVPHGVWLSRVAGIGFIGWGAWMLGTTAR